MAPYVCSPWATVNPALTCASGVAVRAGRDFICCAATDGFARIAPNVSFALPRLKPDYSATPGKVCRERMMGGRPHPRPILVQPDAAKTITWGNHWVTWQGETLTVTQWASRTGIKRNTLYERFRRGWSAERVIGQPLIVRIPRSKIVNQPCPPPRPLLIQPDDPSIRLIPLTCGQVAIVDSDRYDWAMQWNWHARYSRFTKSFYATRKGRRGEPQAVYLHREILGQPHARVDHANGNSLDCRRSNLRECTQSQNIANRGPQANNRSGYPGVYWRNDLNKWTAAIGVMGHKKWLGAFTTKEEAIAARVAAERLYFGEFAFSARCAA